jgi:dimethylaniline monooxygenase (N-oxide forming)
VWSGALPPPDEQAARAGIAMSPPAIDSHNVLAVLLSDAAGVAPDLRAHPHLTEALLFGPMLPPRYRLDGPGARTNAAALFAEQLAASPRAPIEPDDVAALADLGLADLIAAVGRRSPRTAVAQAPVSPRQD